MEKVEANIKPSWLPFMFVTAYRKLHMYLCTFRGFISSLEYSIRRYITEKSDSIYYNLLSPSERIK